MNRRAEGFGLKELMSTSGVFPMSSRTEGYRVMTGTRVIGYGAIQPPATAGRIEISAPSGTGVSTPSR